MTTSPLIVRFGSGMCLPCQCYQCYCCLSDNRISGQRHGGNSPTKETGVHGANYGMLQVLLCGECSAELPEGSEPAAHATRINKTQQQQQQNWVFVSRG